MANRLEVCPSYCQYAILIVFKRGGTKPQPFHGAFLEDFLQESSENIERKGQMAFAEVIDGK